ncbi:MAG: hypothetical protein IJQ50_06295 [Clostridia bacterium]|nr:hypothetical protein [Clostridia bacterium]
MQSLIKLNPDERKPCCECCVYSKNLSGLKELSCEKKGIVSPDYVCKKFSLDILKKTAKRKRTLDKSKIKKMDFSID